MRVSATAICAIIAGILSPGGRCARAQAQPAVFEVASVKPAGAACRGNRSIDAQQIRYANYSLKGLVRDAYKVELYQVNAPDWLDAQCYDVVAKLPEGASKEQIPAMLQALLAERFHMKVHTEARQERVYALIVAKSGPRLKQSKDPSDRAGALSIYASRVEFMSATLDSFCSAISVLLASPVMNMTGIQGRFDITLNVTREDFAGVKLPPDGASDALPENNASSSIFAAMQEIGLKLASRNADRTHRRGQRGKDSHWELTADRME